MRNDNKEINAERINICEVGDVLESLNNKSGRIFRGEKLYPKDTALTTTMFRKRLFSYRTYNNDFLPQLLHEVFFHQDIETSGIEIVNYIKSSDDYFNLLNLLRHYGCPTPSIDWTRNPWIALYFAIKCIKEGAFKRDGIRLYEFDLAGFTHSWGGDWEEIKSLNMYKYPHLVVCKGEKFEYNVRAKSQESTIVYTNYQDLISHIQSCEKIDEKKYLTNYEADISSEYDFDVNLPLNC